MNRVLLAKNYAKMNHSGQYRFGGDKYYYHPLRVFNILKEKTNEEDILIAGLLHDIIEDTDVTYNELKGCFGERVADLVLECTKPYKTLHSKEALMIKFADLLDNVSDSPKEDWIKRKCDFIKNSGDKENE